MSAIQLMRAARRTLALCAVALSACSPFAHPSAAQPGSGPPPVLREFRGVWVATVGNIDWPSRPGLPVDSQKTELLAIMDRAAALRLNAVIFQVRTAGDALYASQLEPWSEYLTGVAGQAPVPLYDPLAFAVEAAHARGMELHAWFNPYRARHPSARSPIAANHLSQTRPELVKRYGTHLWMDPGERAVQDHSIAVMVDVARRYDVDGIHIDDYFYPYRERDSTGVEIPFPDDVSWNRYVAGGGRMTRSDWRRHNVDEFVARLYRAVRATKPWVKFGVSPIGIWRPGHPEGTCCFDAYESIYADARKWFAEGSLDYFVPQLYRTMADTLINYGVMLGWWAEQNQQRRHLYAGMIPNSVKRSDRAGWPYDEIVGQVFVARGHPGAHGHVHFSMRTLMRDQDSMAYRLSRTVYRAPALVPASTWLDRTPPPAPRAEIALGTALSRVIISIAEPQGEAVQLWVVRALAGESWTTEIVPAARRRIDIAAAAPVREVVVTAVDRVGNESRPLTFRVAGGVTTSR